jgi:uncharacterized protein YbjT (DUF2867 family)
MILVTGATGFVGSHLLRRLVKSSSAPVRGLVRKPRTGVREGVEPVVGDLTRPETLGPALAGVSTVVHAAAITGDQKEPYRGAYDQINRVGTENLVAAAREAGVGRFVLMSGLGTAPAPAGTYMAARWAMEEAVRGSGIPHVILQPSVLFGDGAEFVAALGRLARVSPVLPLLGGGNLRFQPLWVEDLVGCLVKTLSDDSLLGRAIALGGPEYVTFREVLEEICRALAIRRLLLPLPLWVARPQARLMAVLPHPPLTPAMLELFAFDNATDLDVILRNFGFQPRGFREHLRAHGIAG